MYYDCLWSGINGHLTERKIFQKTRRICILFHEGFFNSFINGESLEVSLGSSMCIWTRIRYTKNKINFWHGSFSFHICRTKVECGGQCLINPSCDTFNYVSNVCKLLKSDLLFKDKTSTTEAYMLTSISSGKFGECWKTIILYLNSWQNFINST